MADAIAKDISEMAPAWGLDAVVKVHGFNLTQFHVMLNNSETGERMLDYWPKNGTWWNPTTGNRGKSFDAEEVVRIAHGDGPAVSDAIIEMNEHLDAIR